jgi:hypothetical protein
MQKFQRFTGMQYLQIDIASNFGLDKQDWNTRLDWFDENQEKLLSLVPQAKAPALFYAGIQAWNQANQGLEIGYPISLDACSSGLQLLACLTGDDKAAKLCGVIDTGHREDAYSVIYNEMVNSIGESAKISRDDCKDAIMCSLYGSTAVPKKVFGEGKLLQVFVDTMSNVAPAAWALNQVFLDIWDSTVLSHDWVLPDNFHVHVKVMGTIKEKVQFFNKPYEIVTKVNMPKENGRSLGANVTHSIDGFLVRELTRRCDYRPDVVAKIQGMIFNCWEKNELEDTINNHMLETLWFHYQDSGYLSARILDYITEDNISYIDRSVIQELIDSLPPKPFKVMSIHDCFRVLPNYGNDLREQYNLQLMLIAKSNLLGFTLTQIMGKEIKVDKANPNMWKHIMDSNYTLS